MSPAEEDRIVRMVEALTAEVTRLTSIPKPPAELEPTGLFVHPADREFVRRTA